MIPEIGTGASVQGWSDRYPCTVTRVATIRGRTYVTVQEDMIVGGYDLNGYATKFTRDEGGREYTFYLNKNGRWREKGQRDGYRVHFGQRSSFRDPSF